MKKKTGNYGLDFNEFVKVHVPEVSPLPWGGFYRLASRIECARCSREWVQVIRVHKVQLGSFLSESVIHKPVPSDEKIMTTMILRASENSAGCWRNCRPFTHLKICTHIGECRCPRAKECTCPKGCGNRGIHPCACGRMFGASGKHRQGCPVGLYKRTGSFEVAFMRSQLLAPRKPS